MGAWLAGLKIERLEKSFGAVKVLKGVGLDIRAGEFFTLLGPSGCGKTTLMRIVAGFIAADAGSVRLGEERLDALPAHARDIGMVFQDYAVFPHLSVADNVAFGLRTRKAGAADIKERVGEMLRMVRLDGLADRLPSELSGGQQQRVGLARAMVIRPKLLLMDEPLSNLDAKLRLELRDDIRALQKRLGVTTIYVTHDQEEALAVSDRICVMNLGVAEQIGTPQEIYRKPMRRFSAGFVGSMNFIEVRAAAGRIELGRAPLALVEPLDCKVDCAIRPEHVRLLAPGETPPPGAPVLEGRVERVVYLGSHAICAAYCGAFAVTFQLDEGALPKDGETVRLALPPRYLHVFGPTGDRVEIAS